MVFFCGTFVTGNVLTFLIEGTLITKEEIIELSDEQLEAVSGGICTNSLMPDI